MLSDMNTTLLRVLRRWWVVALVALIVLAVAGWRIVSTPKEYVAQALMVVGPDPTMSQDDLIRSGGVFDFSSFTGTYADILDSKLTVTRSMDSISLSPSVRQKYQVNVTQEPTSNVLRISVRGPDQAIVERLVQSVQDNGRVIARSIFPLYQLSSLESGATTAKVDTLSLTKSVPIAAVVALGLGVLAALWVDSLLTHRSGSPLNNAATGTALDIASTTAVSEPRVAK